MKTAIELGISDAELAGLIKVRDYLRGAGADTFEPEEKWDDDTAPFEEAHLIFNMSETCSRYECGTVACIGGSLSLVLEGRKLRPDLVVDLSEQGRANAYVKRHYVGGDSIGPEPYLKDARMKPIYDASPGIAKLFYPRPIWDWDAIRPDVAAEAIDRFLETGDPDWIGIARERGIALEEAFRRGVPMSANEGGPVIRVERAAIPKPRIPRGYVSIALDPADGESGLVAGESADFSLRVLDEAGTAYAARYHGARVVSADIGKASFDVGPEVVVTWEEI